MIPPTTKISIITVAKNAAHALEDTIKATTTCKQDFVEYGVIDGGSTDSTAQILKTYSKHIDYFVSEEDNGISDAFNKGIRLSSGDLIGFINAGDSYVPGAFDAVWECARAKPEFDFYYGDMLCFSRRSTNRYLVKAQASNYSKVIWREMPFGHPTCFVKRSLYERIGPFDTGFRIAMDYEWFLRAEKSGARGLHIPQVLAQMDIDGISQTKFQIGLKECSKAQIRYGMKPLKAFSIYCYRYLRIFSKKMLGDFRIGNSVLKWYQTRFSKVVIPHSA